MRIAAISAGCEPSVIVMTQRSASEPALICSRTFTAGCPASRSSTTKLTACSATRAGTFSISLVTATTSKPPMLLNTPMSPSAKSGQRSKTSTRMRGCRMGTVDVIFFFLFLLRPACCRQSLPWFLHFWGKDVFPFPQGSEIRLFEKSEFEILQLWRTGSAARGRPLVFRPPIPKRCCFFQKRF